MPKMEPEMGPGRNLHRRLVALHRHQRLIDLHRVAGLDQQLDHCHVLEVPDVGNLDFDQGHVLFSLKCVQGRRRFRRTGG